MTEMQQSAPLKARMTSTLLCFAYAAPCVFWLFFLDGHFFGLGAPESRIGTLLLCVAILTTAIGVLTLALPTLLNRLGLSNAPERELNSKGKPTARQRNIDSLVKTLQVSALCTFLFGWVAMTGYAHDNTDSTLSAPVVAVTWILFWGVFPGAFAPYCKRERLIPILLSLMAYGMYFAFAIIRLVVDMRSDPTRRLGGSWVAWFYLILSLAIAGSAAISLMLKSRKQDRRTMPPTLPLPRGGATEGEG
jgi:hypothetical protein